MNSIKISTIPGYSLLFSVLVVALASIVFTSCSSFSYKTYDVKANENVEDPDPDYEVTLDKDFQDYTNFMFIGNRAENFGTYFNTYFNARENYDDAYDIYITRVLTNYGNRVDSVYINQPLTQEAIDLFTKAIEKASKVIQYHKSSALMDRAVLLIGKSYFYLGDYIKAERKFSEFYSKLSRSIYLDEDMLFYSKTQLRLGNYDAALQRLDELIKNTPSNSVRANAFQTIAEYYLYKKDYPSAVENYKKAIEYSNDSQFKAQMQYLLATVAAQTNPCLAAKEYDNVLDFNASYDLEFLSRLNRVKNLILCSDYSAALPLIENLRVKYKDVPDFVAQVEYLQGFYYEQKNDYINAIKAYDLTMQVYPKTVSSSNASFRVANYYENQLHDYLNAYRYYKYSTEESSMGQNYGVAVNRGKLLRQYFDLRSVIIGQQIKTDYDSVFIYHTKGKYKKADELNPDQNQGNFKGGDIPKPGGLSSAFGDSIPPNTLDSTKINAQKVSKARFELAELFDYELKNFDSSEYYYTAAFDGSDDYDFRSKVLYALSGVYRDQGKDAKANVILQRILTEFPLSPIANDVKRLMNISVNTDLNDQYDSLYYLCEDRFNNREYTTALECFRQIADYYPSTAHGIKSCYSAGWIYENVLMKPDSAYIYYSRVVASNPKSDYATAVTDKIRLYEESLKPQIVDSSAVKDSTSLKDSSKVMEPKIGEKMEELKPETNPVENKEPVKEQPKDEMKKEDDKKNDETVPPKKDN